MAESLRERQKQVGRDAILLAFADEVVEHGVTNISLQAVADRAGVSHRTLYNYFENREALIRALTERMNRAGVDSSPVAVPDDFERVPAAIRHYAATWAAQGNVANAAFQLEMAQVSEGVRRLNRPDPTLDAVRATLAEVRPDLDAETREATAHILRTIASGRTWHRMTAEHGVRSELAGDVAAWAWTVLYEALSRGESPEITGDGG